MKWRARWGTLTLHCPSDFHAHFYFIPKFLQSVVHIYFTTSLLLVPSLTHYKTDSLSTSLPTCTGKSPIPELSESNHEPFWKLLSQLPGNHLSLVFLLVWPFLSSDPHQSLWPIWCSPLTLLPCLKQFHALPNHVHPDDSQTQFWPSFYPSTQNRHLKLTEPSSTHCHPQICSFSKARSLTCLMCNITSEISRYVSAPRSLPYPCCPYLHPSPSSSSSELFKWPLILSHLNNFISMLLPT